MTVTNYQTLLFTKLMINTNNPRFTQSQNEHEAIQRMIEEQKEKLTRLAKHILENGLNPAEPLLVLRENDDRYRVLEGNRRITAIKLLHNPNIIDEKNKSFYASFNKFHAQFKSNPIKEIPVIIFDKEDEAEKWIELRHTGENEGVGIVKWDTMQKRRYFEKLKGRVPMALQTIDFLKKSKYVASKIKSDLDDISITNLERLLGDPEVRETIGLIYQNKQLYACYSENEILKGVTKIVKDFLYKDYTVYHIDKKHNRKDYLQTFASKDLPNRNKKLEEGWPLSDGFSNIQEATIKNNKKRIPLSSDRRYLIPKGFVLRITEKRINTIYDEMRNLVVDEFKNSGAVLLRVFLEMSVDAFIKNHNTKLFQGINKNTTLEDKVKRVVQYFRDRGLVESQDLLGISNTISSRDTIFSIDTFHAYVHNHKYNPIPSELKLTWDNIEPFIQKLWD